MRIIFLFVTCLFLNGCTKHDVPPDTFGEPIFHLKGEIDGVPYYKEIGRENMVLFPDLNFLGDSIVTSISSIQHDFTCEICAEKFLFSINSPYAADGTFPVDGSFNITMDSVLSVGEHSYLDNSIHNIAEKRGEKIDIQFYDTNNVRYSSSETSNDQRHFSILELEEITLNFRSAKIKIAFDCNLINSNGDVVELRNFEGVISAGVF